ncbi:uncharacterized protein FIBRA_02313 [Fibroporia radiculosa]|uniref:Uncharacterized protein n=1 Tax=Fibroporia radiculosa TaxID=599839 RepID=J4G1K9_9APHY|nr:uncharacterized protein FIBRA_02313 [Fibroporia radiculosa]CCM00283.1 predicted protein [Fibroporia radiculosa]
MPHHLLLIGQSSPYFKDNVDGPRTIIRTGEQHLAACVSQLLSMEQDLENIDVRLPPPAKSMDRLYASRAEVEHLMVDVNDKGSLHTAALRLASLFGSFGLTMMVDNGGFLWSYKNYR